MKSFCSRRFEGLLRRLLYIEGVLRVVPLQVMFIARAAKSETLLMFNLKRE